MQTFYDVMVTADGVSIDIGYEYDERTKITVNQMQPQDVGDYYVIDADSPTSFRIYCRNATHQPIKRHCVVAVWQGELHAV